MNYGNAFDDSDDNNDNNDHDGNDYGDGNNQAMNTQIILDVYMDEF